MLRSRKKLGMFGSLMPFLGGKRRLCARIFGEIDKIIPRRRWPELTLLDAFLGGGSVSLYAKAQGFRVIATDIAERSIITGRALIENTRVKLSRADILRLLADDGEAPGRVESEMVPATFTLQQGRFIDRALRMASTTPDPSKAGLIRLLTLRVALLAHPMAQVRSGTIHRLSTGEMESITESCLYHYVDGLRLTTLRRLWELAEQINAGVFEGRATVMKRSVLDAVPDIEADVMYADPPYPGVMSYEREYKVIDEILEGASRPTSPFTAKDGANMIDHLFERAAHIPIWILSLGNAVVSIEELEAKMAKHGRLVKSIALRYQHLPAVATEQKKRENKEFIVVGVDEDAPLLRPRLVDATEPAGQLGRIDQDGPVALIELEQGLGGTELPAAQRLSADALEQRQSDLAAQGLANLRRQAVSIPSLRLDDPHAGLAEGSLHQHRDVSDGSLLDHDATNSLGRSVPVKEIEP